MKLNRQENERFSFKQFFKKKEILCFNFNNKLIIKSIEIYYFYSDIEENELRIDFDFNMDKLKKKSKFKN